MLSVSGMYVSAEHIKRYSCHPDIRNRFLFFCGAESRNLFDSGNDLFGRDEFGTFKMSVSAFVARTPQEVKVVEVNTHIVPAAVAGVVIDDTVRSFKFIGRMGEP